MATTMAATIGLGVWIGMKADDKWPQETPWGALIGSVLGVALATYQVIRSLLNDRP